MTSREKKNTYKSVLFFFCVSIPTLRSVPKSKLFESRPRSLMYFGKKTLWRKFVSRRQKLNHVEQIRKLSNQIHNCGVSFIDFFDFHLVSVPLKVKRIATFSALRPKSMFAHQINLRWQFYFTFFCLKTQINIIKMLMYFGMKALNKKLNRNYAHYVNSNDLF